MRDNGAANRTDPMWIDSNAAREHAGELIKHRTCHLDEPS